jgi:hypothetical protein
MTQLRDYGRQIEADPMLGLTRPETLDVGARPPQTRLGRGLAWALAAFVVVLVVGGLNLAFGGDDGQVVDQTTLPTPTTVPTSVSGAMWPQSSLDEVEEAQQLADAGDPNYTWQVDPRLSSDQGWDSFAGPDGPEVIERFLSEELGWDQFLFNIYVGEDGNGPIDGHTGLIYLRCAGGPNPAYPDDEIGGGCAPTIDDLHYETVNLDLTQPAGQAPTGIWVVSRWATGEPFSQVAPQTADAETLVEAFLQARIEGEGAEGYVTVQSEGAPREVPLLYATSSGAPYERFEFERVVGPTWPFGDMEFKVRLFADGGDNVVEQVFSAGSFGPLKLEYYAYRSKAGDAPTTENGQPLPAPFKFFDGVVVLHAAHPWVETNFNYIGLVPGQGSFQEAIELLPDPLPIAIDCQAGPAPADVEALATSIRSNPDIEVTDPITTTVGGVEALQMDVTAASGASACDESYFLDWPPGPTDDTGRGFYLREGSRIRLYLIDAPEGSPIRILAIAIVAPEDTFERLMEAATPIVDSIDFRTE